MRNKSWQAMTTPNQRKAQAFAMAISFLLALPLAVFYWCILLMLDANGHYNHSSLCWSWWVFLAVLFMVLGFVPTSGYGNGYLVLI
jgi:phosphoglycerol transferase MdoB-like AlkP superfamily enzyme